MSGIADQDAVAAARDRLGRARGAEAAAQRWLDSSCTDAEFDRRKPRLENACWERQCAEAELERALAACSDEPDGRRRSRRAGASLESDSREALLMDTQLSSWTERQIAAGRLSPGARRMTEDEAARQYNGAHALSQADPDYLYTPVGAQRTARDVLALVGIEVSTTRVIVLTDADGTGPSGLSHRLNPGQIEAACEEYRLCTGEAIDAEALLSALPWNDWLDSEEDF